MKLLEKIKVGKEREIRFLNIPLFQYGIRILNGVTEKYLEIFPKSFENKALDKILSAVDPKHDDIWVIRTLGLGETTLLNYFIDEKIKKSGVKSPCFVSSRGIYDSLFKMYNDIPFYKLPFPAEVYASYLNKKEYNYKNKKFHIYHCTLEESLNWLMAHRNSDPTHCVDDIKKWWNVTDFTDKHPQFSEEVKQSTLEKVSHLNLDKFVFIAPESNGTTKLPDEFWKALALRLTDNGYDIFVNTADGKPSFGKSAKLSIAESAYLASLAKSIIAIRCGFAEILAAVKEHPTMHILYTAYNPFKNSSSSYFKQIYTLEKYPFYNNETIKEHEILNNPELFIEQYMKEVSDENIF